LAAPSDYLWIGDALVVYSAMLIAVCDEVVARIPEWLNEIIRTEITVKVENAFSRPLVASGRL
jgi:hypothetical protein